MLKKVLMYINSKDGQCDEIRDYLEQQEVHLLIRDVEEKPLKLSEVSDILKHYDLNNFLNTESKLYKKNKLDKSMPVRKEMFEMIASDNELLRFPILVYGRLMTVGCNQDKISEMIMARNNGSNPATTETPRPHKVNRRSKK